MKFFVGFNAMSDRHESWPMIHAYFGIVWLYEVQNPILDVDDLFEESSS